MEIVDNRNTLAVHSKVRLEVKRLANYKCTSCNRPESAAFKLQIHHIVRRLHGGSNEKSNLTALCHKCHCRVHLNDNRKVA